MDNTEKDFDRWGLEKKYTHTYYRKIIFYEREIWWAKIGVNVGVEIDGKHELFLRPVVLLKKFNKHMVLIVPTTGKEIQDEYHIPVSGEDGKIYHVCISQIRTISTKRLFRRVGKTDKESFTLLISATLEMIRKNTVNNETPH